MRWKGTVGAMPVPRLKGRGERDENGDEGDSEEDDGGGPVRLEPELFFVGFTHGVWDLSCASF